MSSEGDERGKRIVVRGARVHNLQNLDVELPARGVVVLTGPSGSGKSSLAFDTIYAEAQRRFVESLRIDARQALARLPAPDVDAIEGLSPAIAIEQHGTIQSPRATLGSASEISDYLRLLFARMGTARCPVCGKELRAETPQRIVDQLLLRPPMTKVVIRAPIAKARVGDLAAELAQLRKDGFVRAVVDGQPIDLGEVEKLDPRVFPAKTHDLDAIVDRLIWKDDAKSKDAARVRASDSIELAMRVGRGRVRLQLEEPSGFSETTFHAERPCCEVDDITLPPVEPRLFSPNTAEGACPTCEGMGVLRAVDARKLVADGEKTLRQGAVAAWGAPGSVAQALEIKRAVDATGIDPDAPWDKLSPEARRALTEGTAPHAESTAQRDEVAPAGVKKSAKKASASTPKKARAPYEGITAWVERRIASDEEIDLEEGALSQAELLGFTGEAPCGSCKGTRLRKEASWITLAGKTISDVGAQPLPASRQWLTEVMASSTESFGKVAAALVPRALARLDFLIEVGLGYLTIDRSLASMSAGEVQRIRLGSALGTSLSGVLHVVDEPSTGLHARDVERLSGALAALAREGNGLIVVEHDLSIIAAADHVVDMGPGAGRAGGQLLAQGPPSAIAANARSVTGPYLSGKAKLPRFSRRAFDPSRVLRMRGASLHNLKGVDVDIPLGLLVVVTGPSGSGKSSLIVDTLLPVLRETIDRRGRAVALPPTLMGLTGANALDKVVAVDEAPIGRSPRSNAATYVDMMPRIRELFAQLPEAKARGYGASRFSPNVKGGRCEVCRGEGSIRIAMSFLPDVWVPCDTCGGARFSRETLEIKSKGRSIADVLALSVEEAEAHFSAVPKIADKLRALREVGLGYLPLGQPATTLSGGEAQRVKLARELAQRATGKTLFVLDEPTTGLHMVDVAVLMEALFALRDQGNTVVVVEHDLDLAARADWIIDLGPDAGDAGGEIVAAGVPEEVANAQRSATARHLARAIERATS